MRIGLVLPALPTYSETFFVNKIRSLSDAGYHVYLFVSWTRERNFLNANVVVQRTVHPSSVIMVLTTALVVFTMFLRKPKRMVRFISEERKHKRKWKLVFENIYVNAHILNTDIDWLHFGFAAMGIRRESVGKAMGAKTAVSFRGYDLDLYPLKRPGCYDLLWKRVDKVHTISEDLLRKAISLGLPSNIPTKKITPAIKLDRFSGERRQFQGTVKILTVARLHWVKGLEYTLEALAYLWHGLQVDFRYTIVGEGDQRERLIYACHQLHIEDKVHFAGRVPHEDVPSYLADNDIYLQYSLHEGFCNAVLEAQAAGLLCIVSDAGGLPENVIDNITGWVVPKRNSQLLAEKIRAVKLLPYEIKEKILRNAKLRIKEEFSLDLQARRFLEFYTNKE